MEWAIPWLQLLPQGQEDRGHSGKSCSPCPVRTFCQNIFFTEYLLCMGTLVDAKDVAVNKTDTRTPHGVVIPSSKYLLSTYYVPSTALDTALNKKTGKNPAFMAFTFS